MKTIIHPLNVEEVVSFIKSQSKNSKIYLGSDSERWFQNGRAIVDYLTVIVIHIDGNSGAKVFGEVVRDRDFDQKPNRPKIRLLTEAHNVCELYDKLKDHICGYQFDIHLDINKNAKYASNAVANEAIGYVKAYCGIVPKIKPQSWAASICADRLKSLLKQV